MRSRWRCQITQQSAGSLGGVLASPTQPVSGRHFAWSPSHSTCMHATKPLAVTASAWWLLAPVWLLVASESPQMSSLERRSPPRRPHSRQRPLPQGRAGCARVHGFLGRTRGACVPRAFLMLKGLARLLVRANASQHLSWVYRVQQVAGGPKPSTALT